MSAREEHFIGPEGAAARPAAPSSVDLEERLRRAVEDGLEGNFARVLRFVRARRGEWIELQSLRVPAGRGTRNRYAHVDGAEAAFTLLRQADTWGAQGAFVIANRVGHRRAVTVMFLGTRAVRVLHHDVTAGFARAIAASPNKTTPRAITA